jgi:hypothetical protein
MPATHRKLASLRAYLRARIDETVMALSFYLLPCLSSIICEWLFEDIKYIAPLVRRLRSFCKLHDENIVLHICEPSQQVAPSLALCMPFHFSLTVRLYPAVYYRPHHIFSLWPILDSLIGKRDDEIESVLDPIFHDRSCCFYPEMQICYKLWREMWESLNRFTTNPKEYRCLCPDVESHVLRR